VPFASRPIPSPSAASRSVISPCATIPTGHIAKADHARAGAKIDVRFAGAAAIGRRCRPHGSHSKQQLELDKLSELKCDYNGSAV
jgi:hypothetical protein